MQDKQKVLHTLEPWFDSKSRVLILGTIPSPKSREYGCYYGHPQNRFWRVLAAVMNEAYPQTSEERREFVRNHHIALWDVLESCSIRGAEDSSISDSRANDLSIILSQADIVAIFTTGSKAKQLYDTHILPCIHRQAIALPSTSPANRRWYSEEALIEAYSVIKTYL